MIALPDRGTGGRSSGSGCNGTNSNLLVDVARRWFRHVVCLVKHFRDTQDWSCTHAGAGARSPTGYRAPSPIPSVSA